MKLILELEQDCACRIGKSDAVLRHGFWRCTSCAARFKYRNAYCHADEGEPPPQEEEAQERFGETMQEIREEP